MIGATIRAVTAYPSRAYEFTPPLFSGFRLVQFLDVCVVLHRTYHCLSPCNFFFFWPLYCLSFELQLLMPLASSYFSPVLMLK